MLGRELMENGFRKAYGPYVYVMPDQNITYNTESQMLTIDKCNVYRCTNVIELIKSQHFVSRNTYYNTVRKALSDAGYDFKGSYYFDAEKGLRIKFKINREYTVHQSNLNIYNISCNVSVLDINGKAFIKFSKNGLTLDEFIKYVIDTKSHQGCSADEIKKHTTANANKVVWDYFDNNYYDECKIHMTRIANFEYVSIRNNNVFRDNDVGDDAGIIFECYYHNYKYYIVVDFDFNMYFLSHTEGHSVKFYNTVFAKKDISGDRLTTIDMMILKRYYDDHSDI
jgi:hypothetical protein